MTTDKPHNTVSDELQPPADFTTEAKTEWDRVIAAVEKTGKTLKSADQSLLTLYVNTWTVNQNAYQHVKQWGHIIKYPNGMPSVSPAYKSFIETGKQLRQLLADLGCTPASRDFDPIPEAGPTVQKPIEF